MKLLLFIGLGFILIAIILYYGKKISPNKNVFINPKTEKRYKVLYRCKVKSRSSELWYDAFMYLGLDDDNLYVRERKDFLSRYIKLKDWKNANKTNR